MSPERDDLSQPIHRPVLVPEVLAHLLGEGIDAVSPLIVDGTVGLGGHAEAVLEARPDVRLLGLDRDPQALELARARLAVFGGRVRLIHASYAELEVVLEAEKEGPPAGVLLDLGVSSLQLDDASRGFSFREGTGTADMRFDPTEDLPTALDLANQLSQGELARIFWEYGDERRSRQVARRLVDARPIPDGARLKELIRQTAFRRGHIDPATRSFQALRIAVNDEFVHLERGLVAALAAVAPGGRIVAISFHSGEDRRVKDAFRRARREGLGRILTRKPLRPTEEEVRENRRARPSRLRAFEKNDGRETREDGKPRKRGNA